MNPWIERRTRRAGEGGFSLLMTLIIMGVAFLIISALLFLTLTTASISNTQLAKAKQWRAADGAMDAAVNKILQDPSAKTGSINETACKPVDTMNIGGVDVQVKCTAAVSDQPFVPVGATEPKSVKVVGTQYRGEPAAIPNAAKNWKNTPVTCPLGDDCFPWAEVLSGHGTYSDAGQLVPDGATVLATGGQPLQIIGDMAVRKGTAAVLNDRTSSGLRNEAPAVAVRGEYSQGSKGVGAQNQGVTLTGDGMQPSELTCGLVSLKNAWAVKGVAVSSTSGMYCNDVTASQNHQQPASTLSAASSDVPRVNDTRPPATTAFPANCNANPVIFQPGAYDKTKTAQLNTWLSSGDSCSNKTFIFRPGAYWFDVDDLNPSLGSRLWRNELRFLDPTITTIFGTPVDNVPAALAAGEALCKSDQPGVGITLSARTSIRHEGGRVAICAGSDHQIALEQAHAVNTGWESAAANMNGFRIFRCEGVACGVWAGIVNGINSAVAWTNGTFGFNIPSIPVSGQHTFTSPSNESVYCPSFNLLAQCWIDVAVTFWGWSYPPDEVGAPINSAQLLLNTSADGVADGTTRIDVVLDGQSSPFCSVTYNQGVDVKQDAPGLQGSVGVYDLLAVGGNASATPGIPMCGARDSSGKTLLNDRKQLYTSKIGVKLSGRKTSYLPGNYGLTITGARLRTDVPMSTGGVQATSNISAGGGKGAIWTDCVLNWATYDIDLGFLGTIHIPYPQLPGTCPRTNQGTFTIPNLLVDDTTFSADPTATGRLNPKLSGIGVNLSGDAISASDLFYDATDGSNYVLVSVMSGSSRLCTSRFSTDGQFELPNSDRSPRTYMALFGPGYQGDSGCAGMLSTWRASDLVGKNLQVQIYTGQTTGENIGCYAAISGSLRGWVAGLFGAECSGWGYLVNDLNVQASFGDCVGGSCETTAANTYDGSSTPMSVTSALQDNATFNVYGDVSLPRSDLDVTWSGSFVTDPIVEGNLWVNAIGSMVRTTGSAPPKVGTLCCAPSKPSERVVRLEAWVGSTLRGSAKVHISDVNTEIASGDPANLDPSALLDETWRAGTGVRVEYWQLCNNKPDPDPTDTGSDVCIRN